MPVFKYKGDIILYNTKAGLIVFMQVSARVKHTRQLRLATVMHFKASAVLYTSIYGADSCMNGVIKWPRLLPGERYEKAFRPGDCYTIMNGIGRFSTLTLLTPSHF